ncbi:WXG100 family type VII secretion target [Streptacidiphilus sp. P02-A3a]|uniref:WXG100 family type VII secretion target n=1 Tax=Streptacidiphilus sp. P02-A3a TaxID=2704468 RepID=UPI0015FCB416|nr:hypothetical protein [Streptacidiphilus sp. P02-A3a]QMU72277.1 hypothetical protein GXP74_32570 [Streptacidiphilus sp. P02-A3a]
MSDCGLPGPAYPGIGFDPTPGDPAGVAELRQRLAGAGAWLDDARALVERVAAAEGPHWQGGAATAFREHVRDGLAPRLGAAHDALRHAADQLQDWHTDLLDRQAHARRLDDALRRLRATPPPTAAQEPGDGDGSALEAAALAADRAGQEADRLLAEAGELERDHAADAARIAAGLDADRSAAVPPGPGTLDTVLAGLSGAAADLADGLYRHAGTVSAASGLLALFPSPLTPLLAGIAVTTGAVQLGEDVGDPGLWAALWPPRPGLDSVTAAVTLGGDAAGVVPGLAAVARGASGTLQGLRAATAAGRAVPVETAAGSFLRDTVTVFSRAARAEAAVRPPPGATAEEAAARRRHLLVGRGVAAAGFGSALYDEATRGNAAGPGAPR